MANIEHSQSCAVDAPSEASSEQLLPSALEDAETQRLAAQAAFLTVQPGQTLKDGRYRPFRKVGEGQFSSVWLARDIVESRYVAIKAGLTWMVQQQQQREATTLRQLRDRVDLTHPGKTHVIELLDDFVHNGPNGSHVCLVFRPSGRQLERVLTAFFERTSATHSFLRQLSIQALQALDYVHQQNFMHGDLHLGNFLLQLTYDIHDMSEAEIKSKNTRGNELNGPDEPFPMDDRTLLDNSNEPNVTLVDLGAATTPAEAASQRYAYPIPYRAPEVVLDVAPINCKADIWALGCLIYRIITGIQLFAPESWGDMEETNLEHITIFIERLGPMPEALRSAWIDTDKLVDSGRLSEGAISGR